MPTQTATTGQLSSAQRTIIAAARFTEEHNTPAMQVQEMMRLPKGASTRTVPKVGQMTVHDLVDGQDIVDSEDIGMTTTDLTAAEVGAKVVITDKLARQNDTTDIFRMVGRQLGEAMARKKDNDMTALYTNLNGGTTLGSAGTTFNVSNASAAVANAIGGATGEPFDPSHFVLHPYHLYDIVSSGSAIGTSTTNFPDEFQRDLLGKFWQGNLTLHGVPMFHDGNISVDSNDDAIGVIAAKDALVTLMSVDTQTRRQRDESLRGTEVVILSDYGVFELDDSRGFPLTFDATAPTTTS